LDYHEFHNISLGSHVPRVRLIRKLALSMNGVDVSRVEVGDTVELDESQAKMMIELGWAEPAAGEIISSAFAPSSRQRRNHSTPK
jgi:hypothetical protein